MANSKNFDDPEKAKRLDWIIKYLVAKDFSQEHMDALCHIIGLFNDGEESEKEIFEFAKNLYSKYAL